MRLKEMLKNKQDRNKAESFLKEYKELCDKHGVRLIARPKFNATSHGSFELFIEYIVTEAKNG